MTYAANKFIPLSQILGYVKGLPFIPDTGDYDSYYIKWIKQATKEIKAYNQIEPRVERMQIVNGKFPEPCNFVCFHPGTTPLVLQDDTGKEHCTPVYHESTLIFRGDPTVSYLTFCIQDGCIVFSDPDLAGHCLISFMGTMVDEYNTPMIHEKFERGIASYVIYMAGLSKIYNDPMITRENGTIWANGKKMYQGDENIIDSVQREKIYRIVNNLFYFGY